MTSNGAHVFPVMSDLNCLYCRNKAVKGPKCIKCDRVFHPKCVERLNDVKVISSDEVLCCEGSDMQVKESVDFNARSIIEFLQSDRFRYTISGIVEAQVSALKDEIRQLKIQVEHLKSTNLDLIKMCTKKQDLIQPLQVPMEHYQISARPQETSNRKIRVVKSADKPQDKPIKTPVNNILKPQYLHSESTINRKLEDDNSNWVEGVWKERDNRHSQTLEDGSSDWTDVVRKKRNYQNSQTVRGKAKSLNLSAAPRKIYIYAGNFELNTEEKAILEHLQTTFPHKQFQVERLPRRENAKSVAFKVTADYDLLQQMNNDEIWPEGVLIKRFIFFRNKNTEQIKAQ
jgi:hypothetical protein